MTYKKYIKENNITKSLSKEEVWIAAQRHKIIEKINERT